MHVLESVGVSELEERVYEALVAGNAATVNDLAETAGATRGQVGQAVGRLVTLGLANRLSGTPARYSAIVPELGLAALVRSHEEALSQVRARAAELTEVYRQSGRMAHPAELVEIVTGDENVIATFDRLQATAREQLRGFDTGPYIDPDPSRVNSGEAAALGRGVTYRTIYDRDVVDFPNRAEHVRAAIAGGEQARVARQLPMKMVICDEQAALIPVAPLTIGRASAYLIYPSALLDALSSLFEAIWDGARPLVATVEGIEQEELSDLDTQLLKLLAAGATDGAIARTLDCSLRTVQRRARTIMDRLGVTTRFQAGLEARTRQWI
ncbi:MAG TPA: helix-turn-helix transcriptional regulator [Jatrophihabitantaceae bacterium]|jgi:sugar-specific transcriptional regulator TrmB/DNA-binding CsgD family transcriptional regulator